MAARLGMDLAALALGLGLIRRWDRIVPGLAVVYGLGLIGLVAAWQLWMQDPDDWTLGPARVALYAAPVGIGLAALVWRPGLRGAVLALVPGLVVLASQIAADRYFSWDFVLTERDDGAEAGYDPSDLDVEALYAAQEPLLSRDLAALTPERPGKADLFVLEVGGSAWQSVFATEVAAVGDLMARTYGAGGRTLQLVNDRAHPLDHPMANHANLARALREIGARMGVEDMLFLYIASHGNRDVIQLEMGAAGLNDLLADDLSRMLDAARVGPSVIVLSACHAGSFIDNLTAPNRLIIAAARADRTSFGCRDGGDWTEFDRLFFDQALRAQPDPRLAFAKAQTAVWWTELAGLRPHSWPQMDQGATVGAALDRLLAETSVPAGG